MGPPNAAKEPGLNLGHSWRDRHAVQKSSQQCVSNYKKPVKELGGKRRRKKERKTFATSDNCMSIWDQNKCQPTIQPDY